MNKVLFFLLFLMRVAVSLERCNFPIFDPQAPHVIYFAIQKDFSNGALAPSFLKEMQSHFGIDTFIETGTHLGNTTARAADIFKTVHTIELFLDYYALATERFKDKENVSLHFGNSGKVLADVLPLCDKRTLFYLDGHYDGGERSGKGEKNTPILEELAAIRTYGKTDAIILIDDLCDFQQSAYPDRIDTTCFADYPDLPKLVTEILTINPTYQLCFLPNALLAYPPCREVTVSPLLSACTIDRFSPFSDLFSQEELLHMEKLIGESQGAERVALETYFHAYSDFEWHFGWRCFASFWMGLISLHQRNIHDAKEFFRQTAQHSLPGWRVDLYTHSALSVFP